MNATTNEYGCVDGCTQAGAAPEPPDCVTVLFPPSSNTGGNSCGVECNVINSQVEDGEFSVEPSASLWHVGTDYFRLTCDDSHSAERLGLECVALAREFRERGDRERRFRYVGGYEDGWSCGPISYAEGKASILVQASGVASDPLFLACKRGQLDVRPTRLDIQTTVQFDQDDPSYARRMAEVVDTYRHSGQREGYPFKVHLRDGKGDGDTLEVGTRGSEVYLRLYDKYREGFKKTHSKQEQPGQHAPGSWRFEGEFKGSSGVQLFRRLCEAPEHASAVLREVRGVFLDHGLEMPIGTEAASPIREVRYRSDVERTRAWLRSAVRPSVRQLLEDGFLGEVLSDLGLQDLGCLDLSALLLTRPVKGR